MSDLRDDQGAEVTITVPADLWRDALTNARAMGLRTGRRTAEDVIGAYVLYLLTRATSELRNARAVGHA